MNIFDFAMKMELDGKAYYEMLSDETTNTGLKTIFARLAADEQKHYDLIKRQHSTLTSESKWSSSSGIKPVGMDLDKPLFPRGIEALEKTIATRSSDWDALLFGLDIELKSYDLYRKAASQIEHPLGKQMFEFLAGQEQSHFNVLMMRYDSLFGPVSWRY